MQPTYHQPVIEVMSRKHGKKHEKGKYSMTDVLKSHAPADWEHEISVIARIRYHPSRIG